MTSTGREWPTASGLVREKLMNLGTLCTRPAVTAPASATLAEIAGLMRDRNVGTVVITKSPIDAPVPVGMVTDRDILRAQLERSADLSRLSAEAVMSADPLTIAEDCDVDEAIRVLRARGVRRAPVLNATGQLVGVVSSDDLVAFVAGNLMMVAAALSHSVRS
jgi:CBS domain-containing protein